MSGPDLSVDTTRIETPPDTQAAGLPGSSDQPPAVGRSVRGALLLGGRQFGHIILSAAAAILLSRWLEPSDYGLFATLNLIVFGAATLLGDLGLTVALVRQQDEPSPAEWAGAVRLTAALSWGSLLFGGVGVAAVIAWGASSIALYVAVLVVALAARFSRAVPNARLQRDMRFPVLAVVETVEMVLYFGLVVTLARLGHGAGAFAIAVAAKEIVGASALRAVAGRPVPSSGRREYRQIVATGAPVQTSGLMVAVTDAFQPVFIGSVLGLTALGYVSWAYNLILMPILLLGAVDRVVLPSLARAQDDPTLLTGLTERAIRLNCLVAFPLVTAVLIAPDPLITRVFSDQWLPASELLVLFAPAILTTAMTAPVIHAFNAVGRTKVAMWLSGSWLAATWTVGALVVDRHGVSGFGWFYVGLQVAYIPVWRLARRDLGIRVLRATGPALNGLAFGLSVGRGLAGVVEPLSWSGLSVSLGVGVVGWLTAAYLSDRATMAADLRYLMMAVGIRTRPEAPPAPGAGAPASTVGADEPWRLGHIAPFDGLRAIAVVAVLAHHAHIPRLDGGFLGVDLFFVLSGFLITALLVQERDRNDRIDFRRFYMRRSLRLFPALLVSAAAVWAYAALVAPTELASDTLFGLPWAVTYTTDYAAMFAERGLGMVNHTWSLAIEEQFYLIWPPVLAGLLARWSRRTAVAVASLTIVTVVVARALVWARTGDIDLVYYPLHARADALLLGCVGALVMTSMRRSTVAQLARRGGWLAVVAAVVFAAIAVVATTTSGWMYLGGLTVVALAALVVIAVLAGDPGSLSGRLLSWRPFTAVGAMSYGLYLWHFPIYEAVKAHWGHLPFRYLVVLQFTLSFAAAALSYVAVERPFLRLKSRFAASTSATQPRGDEVKRWSGEEVKRRSGSRT